ncbi:MAG: dTDP-4-dehydrorhamnose 3,5-epimerase family protein [Candidatus Binatia bacterium]
MGLVIEGVALKPLAVIQDERGAVLHMLRADSPVFDRFGEVYFSEVQPGVVKGWKRHSRMTQRVAVPVGRIRFVIHDNRRASPTRGGFGEYELGRPDAYELLIVPPGVWYAFQAMGDKPALVANCPDLPHDPSEMQTIELSGLDYDW